MPLERAIPVPHPHPMLGGRARLRASLIAVVLAIGGPAAAGVGTGATAYFGVDGPLAPDAWNPLARWMRLWMLAGVHMRGGWGIGAGLYGAGPPPFLGCNPAYSSRPLTQVLGDRVDTFAVTCSAMFPL